MKVKGEVKIFKNGKLVYENHNAILTDLKDYFVSEMTSASDKAINDLFDADDVEYTGAQGGKDGIALEKASGGVVSMTTTQEPDTLNGAVWKGEYTNPNAGDIEPSRYWLGYNFNNNVFEVRYAALDIPSAERITLSQSDSVIVEWTITATT